MQKPQPALPSSRGFRGLGVLGLEGCWNLASTARVQPPRSPLRPKGARRWHLGRRKEEQEGLIPLVFMLGFTALTLSTPLRPMCDQEVMKRFIQEAGRMEKEIEELCRTSCNLPQPITVPDTRVNFHEWRSMDRSRQAAEVWRGQSLLSAAVSQVRSQRPAMEPFLNPLQVMESSLRSVRDILRGHQAQAAPQIQSSGGTLNVETVKRLFSVYTNFLRGKVDLYISGACQGNRR